jgi:uncharacterized protein YraI
MKNLLIAVVIVLFATVAYSAEVYPDIERTSDALVKTGTGTYGGMIVIPDGTNNCTVKVYDNTTNSGRVLDDGICTGASYTCKGLYPWPVSYEKGIYVDITTSGTCTYIIFRSK